MKQVCKSCASNSWTPHSGWVQDEVIYTAYQCMDCGNRQTVSESVKDFNSKTDSIKVNHENDLRNLLKK